MGIGQFAWGALGIDNEWRICVSDAFISTTTAEGDALLTLKNRPIHCSRRTTERPNREYTEWHRKYIFKRRPSALSAE